MKCKSCGAAMKAGACPNCGAKAVLPKKAKRAAAPAPVPMHKQIAQNLMNASGY